MPNPIDSLYRPLVPRQPLGPLDPHEEDDLLGRIAGGAMTGIGYLGDVLDKTFGGRAVRGLLGGHPEEALSVLPLSDTLGVTDYKNRVSGQDLLRHHGLLSGADDDWENVVAGIGTELALDPSTYLTLGGSAITDAGKLAKRLGVLPETMAGRIRGLSELTPRAAEDAAKLGISHADVLNKPLGGLAGLGLPFADPSVVLGTGKVGETIAGGLHSAKEALQYSAPGRYASALFDPTVQGLTSEPWQRELRGRQAGMADAFAPGREAIAQMHQDLPAGLDRDFLRSVLEGHGRGVVAPEISSVVDRARNFLDQSIAGRRAAGLPGAELADRYADYFPRQLSPLERGENGGLGRPLGTAVGTQTAREGVLRDIPGGTGTIQDMLRDTRLAGESRSMGPLEARNAIASDHLGVDLSDLPNWQTAQADAPFATHPEGLRQLDLWDKAGDLAPYMQRVDPQRVGPEAAGLFGNDPLLDLLHYHEGSAKAAANAQSIRRVFTHPDVLAAAAANPAKAEPLADAVARSGFSVKGQEQIAGDLVAAGVLPPGHNTPGALRDVLVPKDVSAAATALADRLQFPEAVAGPLRAWDSATMLNKVFQGPVWPAWHARNESYGIWKDLERGATPGGLLSGEGAIQDLLAGRAIEGAGSGRYPAFAGTSDEEATQAIARSMFAHQAVGPGQGGIGAITGATSLEGGLGSQILGEHPAMTLPEVLSSFVKGRTNAAGESIDTLGQRLNPLNVSGVGGVGGIEKRNVNQFAPLVAGRNLEELLDTHGRGRMFLDRLEHGYSPAAAGAETTASRFDYGHLTDFERKVMKRIVPFYGFERQAIPSELANLAANPGGISSMAIKGAGDLRQQEGFLPDYLGEGLAIPLSAEENGTRKYLTKTMLPFEDVADYVPTGPNKPRRVAENLAGQLNPLIKGPLEMLLDKQLYSGRPLSSLHPITGATALDQAIMNSPLSRPWTTARTLADERKDTGDQLANLLSGARVSDVDVAKQRDLAVRDLLQEYMKGDPAYQKFERFYVRPEDLQHLSPEEIAVLRLNRTLEDEAKKKAHQVK